MSELKTVGKMSQLMFWNKSNSNNNNHNDNVSSSQSNNSMKESDSKDSKRDATKDDAKHGNKRNWLHTPQALIKGHVVYLVKFFGNLPVDQPKGIDVVKDTIRKLQFAQQMRKAETGTQEKFRKVEITISVDGVAIQEPRTQKILHQFPLHNISYCADEKGVKKFFSFIAKTIKTNETAAFTTNGYNSSSSSNSSNSNSNTLNVTTPHESHECFVFISNKLASDITLTIGQAFELAFRKYINNTEKTELGKAQQQITQLEKVINIYKNRLLELSQKLTKTDLDTLLFKYAIKDILEVPDICNDDRNGQNGLMPGQLTNGTMSMDDNNKLLIDTNVSMGMTTSKSSLLTTATATGPGTGTTNATTVAATSSLSSTFLPAIPPRNNLATQILPKSGSSQKMEELLLNSDSDSDFDPRAEETNINGNNSTYNSNGGGYGGYGGSGINMSGNNFKTSGSNDLFGFEPPKSFGQQLFHYNNDSKLQNNNNINNNNNSNNNNINNNNNNNINYISNNNNNNNNSQNSNNFNELNTTPPLLAPPPKTTVPRRSTTNLLTQNSNLLAAPNGVTASADLFGSDPFEMGNNGSDMSIGMAIISAPSIFQKQQQQQQQQQFSKISVDDFTLESLDPLRK